MVSWVLEFCGVCFLFAGPFRLFYFSVQSAVNCRPANDFGRHIIGIRLELPITSRVHPDLSSLRIGWVRLR